MLTGDGETVDWPHSATPVAAYVTKDLVRRLQSKSAIERAIALAALELIHIHYLYASPSAREGARQLRTVGVRIVSLDLQSYCEGYYLNKLRKVFSRFPLSQYNKAWTRKDLVQALMKDTP